MIVKPTRHVVHVADLSDEECAELGPLLRRTAAAVSAVLDPDQVYMCLWSHAGATPGHLDFVVQPVTLVTMARYGAHGPSLQVAMFTQDATPPEAEVVAVCDRDRARL